MACSFGGSLGTSLYESEKTILPNGKITRKCQLTFVHEKCTRMLRNPVTSDSRSTFLSGRDRDL